MATAIVWFRDDLRIADNPALEAAAASGLPVVCVFVMDPGTKDLRARGSASRWWLHHSLAALSRQLERLGSKLVIRSGNPETEIAQLAADAGASLVLWNRRYGEAERNGDARIKTALRDGGIRVQSFNGALLHEPWDISTQAGTPMKVFTPFWRTCIARGEPAAPRPAPTSLKPAPAMEGIELDALGLLPRKPDWSAGLAATWKPGEEGARMRLQAFIDSRSRGYADLRDRPDLDATSGLSPHLRFGEISPRQVWAAVAHAVETDRMMRADADKFLAEIGWREFSYHLLYHSPDLATRNFQPRFDSFPWHGEGPALAAWQKGKTGYPIVDAGMRQLWQTGWMHNRVRMIVGSFLVKHLLIDWRVGETWFWDTLVDADPASNPASWQWVAGSGADAAPYFRIFNPMIQGAKFDPDGAYVRRFVPELSRLPSRYIHAPWTAPQSELSKAGVVLGIDYPHPIVDHGAARTRALDAFQSLQDAA